MKIFDARPAQVAPSLSAPKIVVKDLWMEYQDQRKLQRAFKAKSREGVAVLENINLAVSEGEFVCIVGPSGCGKSTLLNIVGGFVKATRGQVLIDSAQVAGPDSRRIFIFQEDGVFPWLTVEDNICFGLEGKSAEERQRIISHYVEMVGLAGFEKSYPRQLSGGMKQRVELARALAANPDILFMDESFGALDFLTRLNMRAALLRIWEREKKTILFVTHDVEEAVQLADRVVVMGKRPSTISTIIDVNLSRPRDLDSPDYLSIRDEILEVMGVGHAGMSTGREAGESVPVVEPGRKRSALQPKKLDAEVIIVGGGPAGSVLASYLARAGIDHLIVDRVHHPRAHVGESLSYSATHILEDIGFLGVMERESFVAKHGVSWTSWHDQQQIDLDFSELGVLDHSYHVDRAKFDDLLLRHAQEQGTRIFSGAQVDRIDFNREGFASGITVKIGESRFSLKSRVVVDATGRQALLGRQLGLLRPASDFQQYAIHSWFTGVERGPAATSNYSHIHLLPIGRGWAWQVPINDEVTSVGIVTDRDFFVQSGEEVDRFFKWTASLSPILAERMKSAVRLRELRMDSNHSYMMEQLIGQGWLAVGDAAFFIDPIFSSGISTAMHSAKFAAEAIIKALAGGDVSAAYFENYQQEMRRAAGIWQSFVRLFYEVSPIFSHIIADSEYRTQFLKLCEGEIYDSSAEKSLCKLREAFDIIRTGPDHPLRGLLPQIANAGANFEPLN